MHRKSQKFPEIRIKEYRKLFKLRVITSVSRYVKITWKSVRPIPGIFDHELPATVSQCTLPADVRFSLSPDIFSS